jgi:predicted metal-dependent phosphoesterase TrpH
MIKKYADLHIHSYYSDGTMSPEEILIKARENEVGLLAVTDHNILEGTLELSKISNKYNIECIPAVELDSLDGHTDIHILGYGINPSDQVFNEFVRKNRYLLDLISIKLIDKMQNDYDFISPEDYSEFTYDSRKGGWKALHYLMDKEMTKSLMEGCKYYTKYDCSYDCVDFPSVKTVCQYIHDAGGRAVLAHPGVVIKETDITVFQNKLESLIDLGLDGIECYYPVHTTEITMACLSICEKRNLLVTAGSDFHGSFGDADIGEMKVPIEKIRLGDIFVNR